MKMLRRLSIVWAAGAMALWMAGCAVAAPAAGQQIPCSDMEPNMSGALPDLGGCELRIAVENAYQPFSFIDTETGEGIGYDYDIFAEICQRINCAPSYVETSWDAMVALMAGEGEFSSFDVGADGITITAERGQHVDFTIPYIASEQVLMARADEARFEQPEEFAAQAELIIGTQLGTTNYYASVDLVGEDRIVAYDQFGTAVQALINGDVDAVMIDNVAGQGYVGVNADQLKIMGVAVQNEELGFILAKNSHLTSSIDAALAALQNDGTLQALFDKWFENNGDS